MRDLSICSSLISRSLFVPFTSRVQAQSADTLPMLLTLQGHTDTVYSAAYSPDGTRIVTTSWDKTAKVWDASSRQCLAILEGPTNGILSAVGTSKYPLECGARF